MRLINRLKKWAAKDLLMAQEQEHQARVMDLEEQLEGEWNKIEKLGGHIKILEADQGLKFIRNTEGTKALSKTLPLNADFLVQLNKAPSNFMVVRVRLNDFGQPELQVFNGTPLRGVPYAYAQIVGVK